jgi:F420H(2)-dependent quinone reductase
VTLQGEYESSTFDWVRDDAYPPYAEYQERTDREIPVFIATPR